MTFEDAIKAAIKTYFEGDDYDNLETFKGKKYNKKYFDSVKSEVLNRETEEPVKRKKK